MRALFAHPDLLFMLLENQYINRNQMRKQSAYTGVSTHLKLDNEVEQVVDISYIGNEEMCTSNNDTQFHAYRQRLYVWQLYCGYVVSGRATRLCLTNGILVVYSVMGLI